MRTTRREHVPETNHRSTIHDLIRPLARLLGVAPPRGLAGLLDALPYATGRTRAVVASSLLWTLLYAGRKAGALDAEATVWLSLGVVAAALYAVESGGDGRRDDRHGTSFVRRRRPPSERPREQRGRRATDRSVGRR